MHRVVILAIGNELLIGETLDTNTNWLCKYFASLGFQVVSALILPDKVDVISSIVKKVIQQEFPFTDLDLLITTGGLGPTDDDLTLSAIAQALDIPLQTNETAYQWVKEKYQELATKSFVTQDEMNPARAKMAILPLGATPIKNTVGVAPAIKITYQNITIITLPGVPKEMKGFMVDSIQSILSNLFGINGYAEKELWTLCGDESILAPILRNVSLLHPQVYIKSKAKGFGANLRFQIKLHVSEQPDLVRKLLETATRDLEEELKKQNIDVEY